MDLAFRLVHDLGLATLAAFWLMSSMAVYRDARQRLDNPKRAYRLLGAAFALPLCVPLVYLCLRPHETRLERREREAARRWLEMLQDAGEQCLVCRTPIDSSYLCCPGCAVEIRRPCADCGTPVKLHWNACPYCAASFGNVIVAPDDHARRAA